MKKPRDIANRAMEFRESRRLVPDGFFRKTFTLPVDDARAKARELLREYPTGGYMTIRRKVAPVADGGLASGDRIRQTAQF